MKWWRTILELMVGKKSSRGQRRVEDKKRREGEQK